MILAASLWVGDRIKQCARVRRPLPPPGSPNVLLIVLDTVAAGHLSLHGYDRPTSPTLVELAERGIRFDSAAGGLIMDTAVSCDDVYGTMAARALGRLAHPARRDASHAGRVPRGAGLRDGRLRRQHCVLCAATRAWPAASRITEDYIFPELTAFKTAVLVDRVLGGLQAIVRFPGGLAGVRSACDPCGATSGGCSTPIARGRRWSIASSSTGCRGGPQPERPFFAFLNYFDAHIPTNFRREGSTASGSQPTDNRQQRA